MNPQHIATAIEVLVIAAAIIGAAEHKAQQAIAQHRKLKINQRKPAHK